MAAQDEAGLRLQSARSASLVEGVVRDAGNERSDFRRTRNMPFPETEEVTKRARFLSCYAFGTNLREIEFTQCRVFLAVSRSPTKT
jgi:hypothetical protein